MSGGKGGSQTTEVKIPEWLEDAAKANIDLAKDISKVGPIQHTGPTVAAFTPAQQAAFEMAGQAAQAYGMLPEGMTPADMRYQPAPVDVGGGQMGYSAQPLFDQLLADYRDRFPAQAAYQEQFYIDPDAKAGSTRPASASTSAAAAPAGGGGTTYANWEEFGRPWMSGSQLMAAVSAGTMTSAEANSIMRYQDR